MSVKGSIRTQFHHSEDHTHRQQEKHKRLLLKNIKQCNVAIYT